MDSSQNTILAEEEDSSDQGEEEDSDLDPSDGELLSEGVSELLGSQDLDLDLSSSSSSQKSSERVVSEEGDQKLESELNANSQSDDDEDLINFESFLKRVTQSTATLSGQESTLEPNRVELKPWERFPKPGQLQEDSMPEREGQEGVREELPLAESRLVYSDLFSETVEEGHVQEEAELMGTSTFIRAEMDISLLFVDGQDEPKQQQKGEETMPDIAELTETDQSGIGDAALQFALARCNALESKVEALTRELELAQQYSTIAEDAAAAASVVIEAPNAQLMAEQQRSINVDVTPVEEEHPLTEEQLTSPLSSKPHVTQVQKQLEVALARAEALERENNRLSSELADMENRLAVQTSQVVDQLQSDLQQKEKANLDLIRVEKELRQKVDVLVQENTQLKTQADEQLRLQATVEQLEASLNEAMTKSKRMEAQILQMGWAQNNNSNLVASTHKQIPSSFSGEVSFPSMAPPQPPATELFPPRSESPPLLPQQQVSSHEIPVHHHRESQNHHRESQNDHRESQNHHRESQNQIPQRSLSSSLASLSGYSDIHPSLTQEDGEDHELALLRQEEQVLRQLQTEKVRFQQAQARIRAASIRSTKSLEFAMNELRAMEQARTRAEIRARTLEEQLERTRRDIESVHHVYTAEPVEDSWGTGQPAETKPLPLLQATHHELPPKRPTTEELPDANQASPNMPVPEKTPPVSTSPTTWYDSTPNAPQRTKANVSQWSFADMFPQEEKKESSEERVGRLDRTPDEAGGAALHSGRSISPTPRETSSSSSQLATRSSWADGAAPFATEKSTRDFQKGFSLLERKLMMINLEREQCEADLARLDNKGVRTKKALDDKAFLESRIAELHQEASNVRIALKRAPK